MTKKRIIILIVVLIFLCGLYFFHHNLRMGEALFEASKAMREQTRYFASAIGVLLEKYEDPASVTTMNLHEFQVALASLNSSFGYEDMPMLDDVRLAYAARFGELRKQTLNGNEAAVFTEKSQEMADLKKQLETLNDHLNQLMLKYVQRSTLGRGFTVWEAERRALSDAVSIP